MAVAQSPEAPEAPSAASGGGSALAFGRETVWPALIRGGYHRMRGLVTAALAWTAAVQVLPNLGYYPASWPTVFPFFIAVLGYLYPLAAVLVLGTAILLPLLAFSPLLAVIFLVVGIVLVAIFAPNWRQLLLVLSASFFGSIGLWFLPPLVAPVIWGGRRVVFTALGALLVFGAAALNGDAVVAGFLPTGGGARKLLSRPLPVAGPLNTLAQYDAAAQLAAVEAQVRADEALERAQAEVAAQPTTEPARTRRRAEPTPTFTAARADAQQALVAAEAEYGVVLWRSITTEFRAVVSQLAPLWQQPYALFELATWAIAAGLLLGVTRALFILSQGPSLIPAPVLNLSVLAIALLIAAIWLALSHWLLLPILTQVPLSDSAAAAVWLHTLRSFAVALAVTGIMQSFPEPADA